VCVKIINRTVLFCYLRGPPPRPSSSTSHLAGRTAFSRATAVQMYLLPVASCGANNLQIGLSKPTSVLIYLFRFHQGHLRELYNMPEHATSKPIGDYSEFPLLMPQSRHSSCVAERPSGARYTVVVRHCSKLSAGDVAWW